MPSTSTRLSPPTPSINVTVACQTATSTLAISAEHFINLLWLSPATSTERQRSVPTITTCCSTDCEKPHRCCHLPNYVENIDRTPDISCNLQLSGSDIPQSAPSPGGSMPHQNMVTWAHKSTPPNGISILSAVLAQIMTNRHTDGPRYNCSNRPHLMPCIAMQHNTSRLRWICLQSGQKLRVSRVMCKRRCASPAAATRAAPWTNRRTDRRTRHRFDTLTAYAVRVKIRTNLFRSTY